MKSFCILLSLVLSSFMAWSFPENVRHGYFNCIACHVSPSGGGVLTPYGRSLSAELMSTWGTSKNAGPFFSDNEKSRLPEWFRSNTFLRSIQVRRDTPTVERAQFIPMQADVELGADFEKLAIVGTLGFRAKENSSTKDLNEPFSRRHYFLYRFSENWIARAGKFMAALGINGPDHVTATRRGLGWDQGNESYNAELSFLGENYSAAFTVLSALPNERGISKDSGVGLNQTLFLFENSRLGITTYWGNNDSYSRSVIGPFWIISITDRVFLASEIFRQQKNSTSSDILGYATFHRIGYEPVKGAILFTQFDRLMRDIRTETSRVDSYGVGLQWLPYPHIETVGFLGKEKIGNDVATNIMWLMVHLYL